MPDSFTVIRCAGFGWAEMSTVQTKIATKIIYRTDWANFIGWYFVICAIKIDFQPLTTKFSIETISIKGCNRVSDGD